MHLTNLLLLGVAAFCQLASAADVKADISACLNASRVDYVSGNYSEWGNVDRSLFNSRLQFKPVLIVLPTNTSQVQAAVSCGVKSGVRVTPKCGGHGYAATAFGGEDGHLVIDLGQMKNVTVGADNVARIQGGARLGVVASRLYEQGKRAISHGTCPGVGISGHVLGGGYGMASHTYGLALDWLTGATVVLANSSVVHTSATENPDLFWALRGAGSSFGVVTEYEFKTFAAPTNVTYYSVSLNWPNANNMTAGLKAVQTFAATTMPPELNMRIALSGFSRSLEGVYYGNVTGLQNVLGPLLNQTNGRLSTSKTVGWIDGLKYFAYTQNLIPADNYNQHELFYSSSLTSNALTDSQLASFSKYLFGLNTGFTHNWWIQIDLHGGPNSSVAKVSPTSTAYAHRDKLLLFQLYDRVFGSTFPAAGFDIVQGMRTNATVGMAATDWGMYINYPDTQIDAQMAQEKYWGQNLARLQQIKKRLDPNEVFWNPQSVRPAK